MAGLDYNMEVVFYVVNLLMVIVGMTSIRVTYRAMRRVVMQMKINQNASNSSRVLIVGAGVAGNMIMRELFENPELKKLPVAVIDDDREIGKIRFWSTCSWNN